MPVVTFWETHTAGNGDCFLRTFSRIILYKIENTAVAATGFFAGEVKIFDFVTERVKRCIAAKHWNVWINYEITQNE